MIVFLKKSMFDKEQLSDISKLLLKSLFMLSVCLIIKYLFNYIKQQHKSLC